MKLSIMLLNSAKITSYILRNANIICIISNNVNINLSFFPSTYIWVYILLFVTGYSN